ncbi:hypothetical protein, partial [Lysinibacillus sp. D4A3_S15]|uniref:hypothetical protein n=1 Tax=Lysinibacillus sp. D4A3_S15 TaxID=2941227 RepID=UPI0020BFE995
SEQIDAMAVLGDRRPRLVNIKAPEFVWRILCSSGHVTRTRLLPSRQEAAMLLERLLMQLYLKVDSIE